MSTQGKGREEEKLEKRGQGNSIRLLFYERNFQPGGGKKDYRG